MKNFFKFTKPKVFLAIFLFLVSVMTYLTLTYDFACGSGLHSSFCPFFESIYQLSKHIPDLFWQFVIVPVFIVRPGDFVALAMMFMLRDYFLSCVIILLFNQARRLIKDSPSSDQKP